MAENQLKHLLKKIRMKDIPELLSKWNRLPTDDITTTMTKFNIVNHILESCTNLKREDVWQLDLLHLQKNPSNKMWTTYNYQQVPGTEPPRDINEFVEVFRREMRLYYASDVSISESSGVYWVRIWLHEHKKRAIPKTTEVTYIAYVPGTDFFFITPIKRVFMMGIIQALMMTLDGRLPQKQELHSKHLFSLIQLKNDQGGLNSKGLTINAIQRQERVLKERMLDADVDDEDEDLQRLRIQSTDAIYGQHLQPRLDKVEFKLVTPFRPAPDVPVPLDLFEPGESFNCDVTFSGQNVIEGIRKLAELGLADLPLPTHLRQLHTRGISKITLKPKDKQRTPTR